MSEALLSNPCLSCTTFSASSKLAQTMTKTDCIDNIWDRCSSKLLESKLLALRDLLSLDHARYYEAREKLLQDCSAREIERPLQAEGNIPKNEVLVRSCEKKQVRVAQLVLSTMRVVEDARGGKFTSSQILSYVWENRRRVCQTSSSHKSGQGISNFTKTPEKILGQPSNLRPRISWYQRHDIMVKVNEIIRAGHGDDGQQFTQRLTHIQ